jgi:hypothetical protein
MKLLVVIISTLALAKFGHGAVYQFPSNFMFGAATGKLKI